MRTFFAALSLCLISTAALAATKVTISDKVYSAQNGQPASGSITISWQSFQEPDGTQVPASSTTVQLVSGNFVVQLYPTDVATPAGGGILPVYYNVEYDLENGAVTTEQWNVPTTVATIKISNVLVAVPPEVMIPIGSVLPGSCSMGDMLLVTGVEYICLAPNAWAAIQTVNQALGAFIGDTGTTGIVVRGATANASRIATSTDLTNLLGYVPTKPANGLSEYSGLLAPIARGNLGLGSAAVDAETKFLFVDTLAQPNGEASLDVSGKVPVSQLPTLPNLSGLLSLSQINIGGTAAANTYLNGTTGWTQVQYSQLSGAPTIPTDDSQLLNGAGYAKTANLAVVATTGRYTDLLSLPTLGSIASHPTTDFLSSLLLGAPNGVAPLTAGGLIALSFLPTIPNTQISGLGTASTNNTGDFISSALLGAANGVATLNASGVIPSTEMPTIAYSSLSGLPSIPTLTSQITNDSGFITLSALSPVATSGSYLDLSNRPALNFDPSGAAAAATASALQKAANLSDLASIATAKSNLGLAAVASTGAYADLTGKPVLATVATSGSYLDLSNKPTIPPAYTLPVATSSTLGGVICGTNTTCAVDGTISVAGPYTLPAATLSTLGGVIAGSHLDVTSGGILSVHAADFDPAGAATTAVAGRLIASNNLSDLISVPTAKTNLGLATVASTGAYTDLTGRPTIPPAYTLPAATATTLGGVKCGANTTCAVDGTISASSPYTLPAATASVIGGVKPGTDLTVAGDGTLNVTASAFDVSGAATTALGLALQKANNLSDLASIPTARTNLGLATVASTGDYADLTGKPTIPPAYTLPVASTTTLGGIKCGTNTTCDINGVLSVSAPYTLPAATVSTLGGVIVGSHLDVAAGVLSVHAADFDAAGSATTAVAGRLLAANNLSDLVSVSVAKTNLGLAIVATSGAYNDLTGKPTIPAAYTLPAATVTTLGGVKCGTNVTCAVDGTISAANSYVLPAATSTVIGGVKPGTDLTVSGDGTLNVTASAFDAAGTATTALGQALQKANNLSDLANTATARTNLGLATVATTGAYADLSGKPILGTIASHDAADYVLTTAIGAINGIAPLDATSKVPLANLPNIPSTQITGFGNIVTHNASEFVLVTQVGAPNGVASLDATTKVPVAQIPQIAYGSLSGIPTFALVATSGSYLDLSNRPTSLPPGGTASGDLAANAGGAVSNYPNPFVTGINGQNMKALGAGILKQDANGVPHLAVSSDIVTAFGYTPLNPANNLSDVASAATSRTNLGLTSMATASPTSFLADSGASGLVFRTTPGVTRAGANTDIINLLGYTPMNQAVLGAANGAAELDASGHLLTAELPTAIPWASITGAPTFLTTAAIGTTVAPLVGGLVPASFLPPQPAATTTTLGEVIVGSHLDVVTTPGATQGTISVHAADFDAAGAAAAATSGSLQKANNLSDVASVGASRTNLGLATVAATGAYADLTGKPALATVATSGSYLDLSNKPTIPTLVSQLTNDSGYLTAATIPAATTTTLGSVIIGSGLSVVTVGGGRGTISVNYGNAAGTAAVGNDPRIVGALQSSLLGVANGIATLDSAGHLPVAQLPTAIPVGNISGLGTAATHAATDFVLVTAVGAANGVASLDTGGHVPLSQIPNNIPYSDIVGGPTAYTLPAATALVRGGITVGAGLSIGGTASDTLAVQFGTGANQALSGTMLGAPNGVAPLDVNSKVPMINLPAGTAGGLATLDGNIKIPVAQIPTGIPATDIASGDVTNVIFEYLKNVKSDIQAQIDAAALGTSDPRTVNVARCEPGVDACGSLPASGSSTIFSYSGGPGNVDSVQLAIAGNMTDATMVNSHIQIVVDGATAVDAEVGIFFELYGQPSPFATKNISVYRWLDPSTNGSPGGTSGTGEVGAFRRIFVPWKTSISISISNTSGFGAAIFSQSVYQLGTPPPDPKFGNRRGVLHSYSFGCCTNVGTYGSIAFLPTVSISGVGQSGVLDSVTYFAYNLGAGTFAWPSWLEGDPDIVIDGVTFQYGGSEDFFLNQYYGYNAPSLSDEGGQKLWSVNRLGSLGGSTCTFGYRFFHDDPMIFNSSISVTMFNGQSGQGPVSPPTVGMAGLVLYYTAL